MPSQKKAAVAAGLNLFKINNAEVRDEDPYGARTMPQLEGASLLRALSDYGPAPSAIKLKMWAESFQQYGGHRKGPRGRLRSCYDRDFAAEGIKITQNVTSPIVAADQTGMVWLCHNFWTLLRLRKRNPH